MSNVRPFMQDHWVVDALRARERFLLFYVVSVDPLRIWFEISPYLSWLKSLALLSRNSIGIRKIVISAKNSILSKYNEVCWSRVIAYRWIIEEKLRNIEKQMLPNDTAQ